MIELAPNALHAALHVERHAELRALIASNRQRLEGAINAKLTRLYWSVGERLRTEVLGDSRAEYGARLLDQLRQQLASEFGRGFESRDLRRMVKFAEAFPDAAIVSTLSAKLSWSKSCIQPCLKRLSGWRGAGRRWGTWMTSDDMKVSKGSGFPSVALPGVEHMPVPGEDEKDAARVFYVAAKRATQNLVIGGERREYS